MVVTAISSVAVGCAEGSEHSRYYSACKEVVLYREGENVQGMPE